MQLYFRETQLNYLDRVFDSVGRGSNFVLLYGKRKVGKTTLVSEHLRRRRGAYITVSSKSSVLQLHDISDYLKSFHFTDSFVPAFRNWREFFEFIFYIAKDQAINLAIDEFHNFERVEPEVFEELKRLWDKHAHSSNLNLIAITSDQDFIQRRFSSVESPLYHINQNTLKLTPFCFPEVTKIMQLHDSILPLDEIIKIYMVFGGLPKYYALIDQFELWNRDLNDILKELVFKKFAPLGYELKELIVNDFNRGNTVYLSVLQAIASGYRTVSEIANFVSIPSTSVIKYISELERKKTLIKRKTPLGTIDPSKSKYGKYYLSNYFDNFWFRFIQPDIISYEMGQFDKMLHSIATQLPAYFQERMALVVNEILRENTTHPLVTGLFNSSISEIGQTWTRDGHLDVVIKAGEVDRVVLGKILHKNFNFSADQLAVYHHAAEASKKIFPGFNTENLLITWETPSAEFSDYLDSKNINHLLLYDILSLSNYQPKQSRTLRSKTPRLRKTEPVQRPVHVREL